MNCAKLHVRSSFWGPQDENPGQGPIGLVFIGLEGDVRRLTFYQRRIDAPWLVNELAWRAGELDAYSAGVFTNLIGDALYNELLCKEGFQEELELVQPADRSS